MMRLFKLSILTLILNLAGCVSSSGSHYYMENIWFKGTMDEALQKSKDEQTPLFLYWGAVWCPPCNEIKAEVFSKPRFGELMQSYIAVYLDGDTEEAQIWADRLNAYGYPTILVLDSAGQERARIDGTVNMQEFELALQGAQAGSLKSLMSKVKSGKLDRSAWQALAYTSWGQVPKDQFNDEQVWQSLELMMEKVPSSYEVERSLIAAQFLSSSIDQKDHKNLKEKVASYKNIARDLLELIFTNEETIISNRGFINGSGAEVLAWAFGVKSKDYDLWRRKWLEAAELLQKSDKVSLDTRLWASYPQIQFYQKENKDKPIPEEVKAVVESAAMQAVQDIQNPYEHKTVVPGAAYLLRLVGSYDQARKLLLKEMGNTDAPYYFQSSLSSLASAQGDKAEALKWAKAARESAKGRATKLQWISNDLMLTAKVKTPEQKARLLQLSDEFYQLATALNDGFAGRNYFRSVRVAEVLKEWKDQQDFKVLLRKYQKKCSALTGDSLERCEKHFGGLL